MDSDGGFHANYRAGRLPTHPPADSLLNRMDANGLSLRELIAWMGDN